MTATVEKVNTNDRGTSYLLSMEDGREIWCSPSKYADHPIEDAQEGDVVQVWLSVREKNGKTYNNIMGMLNRSRAEWLSGDGDEGFSGDADVPFDSSHGNVLVAVRDDGQTQVNNQRVPQTTHAPSQSDLIIAQVAIKAAVELEVARIVDDVDGMAVRIEWMAQRLYDAIHRIAAGANPDEPVPFE
jgi:hypothetical protein